MVYQLNTRQRRLEATNLSFSKKGTASCKKVKANMVIRRKGHARPVIKIVKTKQECSRKRKEKKTCNETVHSINGILVKINLQNLNKYTTEALPAKR